MASVTRESIGNLHDKLIVKLDKQDYMPLFEKELKTYSKRANIPGFRKGMVPAGMIRKMYGKQLYAETVLKSAEDQLKDYLVNEKVDIFGQPLFLNEGESMPNIDVQKPEEYEFLFEIGLRPEVNVAFPQNASATFYKVKVKPEDIDQRIENFQTQFGELKEADAVEGPENVLNLTISKADESGNVVEGGFSDDTSLYVKVFNEDFQNQLTGKKKGDVVNGILGDMIDAEKYPNIYEKLGLTPSNEADRATPVQLKITGVNTLEKAPVNEELFKKAFPSKEITDEETFRKAIEEDEQKYWNDTAKNYLEHSLHHLLTEIPVDLPEDFLKKMLNVSEEQPMSQQEIEQKYPSFAEQLKWSLISQKIVEEQNLSVTREEIKENIADELKQYFGTMNLSDDDGWLDSYVDRVMTDKKQIEQRMDKLMVAKIFDWAKSQVTIHEKEISQEDFQKELEAHQHQH